MKRLLLATFTFAFALSPIAEARKPSSHRHYKNKDGREVDSPSKNKSGKAPQGAAAQCCDSSYSFSAFVASIHAGREREKNQHSLE